MSILSGFASSLLEKSPSRSYLTSFSCWTARSSTTKTLSSQLSKFSNLCVENFPGGWSKVSTILTSTLFSMDGISTTAFEFFCLAKRKLFDWDIWRQLSSIGTELSLAMSNCKARTRKSWLNVLRSQQPMLTLYSSFRFVQYTIVLLQTSCCSSFWLTRLIFLSSLSLHWYLFLS